VDVGFELKIEGFGKQKRVFIGYQVVFEAYKFLPNRLAIAHAVTLVAQRSTNAEGNGSFSNMLVGGGDVYFMLHRWIL
jgi:hypothetical protein